MFSGVFRSNLYHAPAHHLTYAADHATSYATVLMVASHPWRRRSMDRFCAVHPPARRVGGHPRPRRLLGTALYDAVRAVGWHRDHEPYRPTALHVRNSRGTTF